VYFLQFFKELNIYCNKYKYYFFIHIPFHNILVNPTDLSADRYCRYPFFSPDPDSSVASPMRPRVELLLVAKPEILLPAPLIQRDPRGSPARFGANYPKYPHEKGEIALNIMEK
jgi:hypothetical protein